MSVTVQSLYSRICITLLEDTGLQLGTVTQAQFLDYLAEALLEFCQLTGMVKKVHTQMVLLGQSQYIVPDDVLAIQQCFIGGAYIDKTTLEELGNDEYAWARQVGQPQRWFADGLPVSTIQLFPIPDYNGTEIQAPQPPFGVYGDFFPTQLNLSVVGTAGPSPITINIGDNVPIIPDSFTPYLAYRVLQKIFSMDGEAKDSQRATYCGSRFEEGVKIAQAVQGELLND